MRKKRMQISLIITESCPLACNYCYEIHKENQKMTFEKAKEHIDKEFAELDDDTEVNIEFFGGEPFLNFGLIEQVIAYVETQYQKRMIAYNTTTSGVIINDHIKNWLWEHRKHFYVALSLDGVKEAHDKNRVFAGNKKGTFDSIDQKFFFETYHPLPVKATIAPNCLEQMAESVIYLIEKGYKVDATLAMGDIDWSNPQNVDILIRELSKLIEYYDKHPDTEAIRMLDIPFEALLLEKKETTRYCGAGLRIHCYTGNDDYWTPCQGFSKITVGEEVSTQYAGEDFEGYVEPESVCTKCPLNNVCSRCWGTNLAATGSIHKIDPWLCVINRIILQAGSKIRYDKIMKKPKSEWTEKESQILKCISIIMDTADNSEIEYLSDQINKSY